MYNNQYYYVILGLKDGGRSDDADTPHSHWWVQPCNLCLIVKSDLCFSLPCNLPLLCHIPQNIHGCGQRGHGMIKQDSTRISKSSCQTKTLILIIYYTPILFAAGRLSPACSSSIESGSQRELLRIQAACYTTPHLYYAPLLKKIPTISQ